MEKFSRFFFSMRMMVIGLVVFLVAIAWATILESIYDIQTAKILVYNAFWFEVLLTYLGINLIANIFRHRMYRREKIAVLMFHLAFIVIIIGSAITRFVSIEGLMLIREGAQTDFFYSSDPYLWFKINDGEMQYSYNEQMFMSEVTSNDFELDIAFPKHKTPIQIEYVAFQKKMIDSLIVNDSIATTSLEIITDGMSSNYLSEGGFLMLGDVAMSFNKKDAMPGIEVFKKGKKILIKTQLPMRYLPMAEMQKARQMGTEISDSLYRVVPVDTLVPFETTTLYQVRGEQFVFKEIIQNSNMMKVASGRKDVGTDILTLRVTDASESKLIELEGGQGAIPEHVVFGLNGLTYEMEYGSMRIPLPFAIRCNDFQLDRYPGSDSPSSFASEVTIIDEEKDYTRDQRIFMNNVMDYRGYRFFQSSYDPDEGGTRLSVNHDWWGTNISYLGYLMMGIGMFLSLLLSTGRFRELNQKLKKSRAKREKLLAVFIGVFILGTATFAQSETDSERHKQVSEPVYRVMSKEHSEDIASLLIQDFSGRIIPLHTLCDQFLRKISRSNTYENLNAVQTIVSMHMYRDYWLDKDIIYVSSKSNLREELGMNGSLISFRALTDDTGMFKLSEEYAKAHQKLESQRGEYDKKLIKLVERYQVVQSIFGWHNMKILPLENDPNDTWYIPFEKELMTKDSNSTRLAINYFNSLDSAAITNRYGRAMDDLGILKEFQRDTGKKVVPSESKIALEITYNKMNIFKNSYRSYLTLGFVLLLLFFVKIFVRPTIRANLIFKRISQVITWLIIAVFLYHGAGIYMRWDIAGHVPWSNGYEAVVFIAWVTMLTGLLFSNKNAVILGATAILASLMIFVTEMNLMDPEITPLQPVLKSYWLMIHVAVITGSYGPLGISCILGILNLLLYIFRTKKNGQVVTMNINELTYVSEMTMTVGIFMLAIGTFLGGIWANESWGRYWGWDPKETWALVAILVYAVILHLRYIPSLRGKFTFNVAGVWGYASILFTFFGVNFYLVGLHSYAQGEGLAKFPTSIIVAALIFVLFTFTAGLRNYQYGKSLKSTESE